ncbi:hypothetical protein VOLCADRAFT_60154 [Volvox carteri f. nagariensis]|uniref:Uncharacterized protein n=1 Tax=Volvox carteri f. nagariensis TaxID=3068 RepID=D8TUF3_VOLCA|nr:uncharacterized protein VOLCADRAFT_60154 [Volvox carteri f. nagariensis]EFJ48814.1 hypothetical protein VOLCADRAFT_60154 [Volvox carteri f. nagariensis]|eukprot:XP_002950146.1 hypothetical protein VOLCADRAFT_60154 [Volvox carteri f. nagariensis]
MSSATAHLVPISAHVSSSVCVATQACFPPINFIYGHFHNSIRAELHLLADRVRSLEVPAEGVELMLSDLRERYKFLEQVYKYHSTVEDEVLYPALDAKVRNVTLAYSIEHQDEEILFEQLSQLLTTALEESESKRKGTIRALICKVEEIHTTLRKHLAKEEEQLLPLLLQHFSFAEQAELVAQFLYSIPLETVERVLSQLKPRIPRDEQEHLLVEIRNVIPDNLLSQLLMTWLRPAAEMNLPHTNVSRQERPADFVCCGNRSACMYMSSSRALPAAMMPDSDRATNTSHPASSSSSSGAARRAPLQDIIHFHRIICSSLADFAREARALQLGRDVTAAHLSALLERHRFLRSVYVFHSISEEEVLFPEVQRLAANVGGRAAHQCEKDHQAELSSFEDLGRMLADVRSFARRGRKVASMLEKLCCSAEAVHASIQHHMQREETDVFPLLEMHLCEAQQRMLVYRTIRAMPLRLLERVMPWVVSGLDDVAAASLLSNIRLGAPPGDLPLVELLSRWARRGRPSTVPLGAPETGPRACIGPLAAPGEKRTAAAGAGACGMECDSYGTYGLAEMELSTAPRALLRNQRRESQDGPTVGATPPSGACCVSKQRKLDDGQVAGGQCDCACDDGAGRGGSGGGYNPIDHIFQFHKALRQELKQMEADAMRLEHLVLAWGIYRAHSKSEDEIVFPALEAKQALRNVSHAYTLDHRQEEQLLPDAMPPDKSPTSTNIAFYHSNGPSSRRQAIDQFRAVDLLKPGHEEELSRQVMGVRRMCAAIRASLETHIRSEESELWPLFTEHFSREEQQYLVGVIIGRTGAQVLQALLPWVSETFSEEERDAMMDSLRAATRNTMFDQWLEAVQGGAGADGSSAGGPSNAPSAGTSSHGQGAVADNTSFRPGWEDIFRMNQQQLEAAIHRVSNDPSLEPERKAYLMQNIMVSKYIVAQQRRMAKCPAVDAIIHRTCHDAAAGILGCQHYQRKCQLVAPCCGKIFTCRLCHDAASDHRMDRYAVTEMRCMMCGTRQPVGAVCRCCSTTMARYVCNICHLFDDEPGKDIYHCPFCNVCRRGRGLGVDFFHCMNCNACMSLTLFSSHKCREKCIEGNCPVCHEALFDSSQPIKELPCGHFMHSSCFLTYTRYNYTCPLCCKSVGDMSVYFQMLDSLLASERLPPEYSGRMQQVLCNDCGKMGFAPFHFVYHSCPHCRSYNTRVL